MDAGAPKQPENSPGPLEGEGGPRLQRDNLADLKLFRQALGQSWVIPSDLKAGAVKRLAEMLGNDKAGARAWTAAARTLVAMTGANLAAVDAALRARAQTELLERIIVVEARLASQPPDETRPQIVWENRPGDDNDAQSGEPPGKR